MNEQRSHTTSSYSLDDMNEERQLFARKLYEIELRLGGAFHTVNNENDCDAASEQLDDIMQQLGQMRRDYEIPLSDEQQGQP